ncbi:6298_t:CDS:2, partial [Funneliformis geosporum]
HEARFTNLEQRDEEKATLIAKLDDDIKKIKQEQNAVNISAQSNTSIPNKYVLFDVIPLGSADLTSGSVPHLAHLFDKAEKTVKWSTNETKQRVYEGFKNISGMKNVIGAIDGSHIVLANVLLKQPETYWSRKKRYSIQLQRIVDHKGIFIDYEIGWSGSVHDARVYKNSHFYLNASEIIKGNEFLLEDSAYPISTFVIKPFTNS